MSSDVTLKLLNTASKCAELVIGIYECQATLESDEIVIKDLSQAVLTALDCLIENKAIDSAGLAEICTKSARKTQIDRLAYAVSVLLLQLLSGRENQDSTQPIPSSTIVSDEVSDEAPLPPSLEEDDDDIQFIEIVDQSIKQEPLEDVEMIKDEAADPQDASELMMIESVDESVLSAPEDIQLESAAIKVEETDETQDNTLPPDNRDLAAAVKQEPIEQSDTTVDALMIAKLEDCEATDDILRSLLPNDPKAFLEVKMEISEQSAEVLIPNGDEPMQTTSYNDQDLSQGNEANSMISIPVDPTDTRMNEINRSGSKEASCEPAGSKSNSRINHLTAPTEARMDATSGPPLGSTPALPSQHQSLASSGYSSLNSAFGSLKKPPGERPPKKKARITAAPEAQNSRSAQTATVVPITSPSNAANPREVVAVSTTQPLPPSSVGTKPRLNQASSAIPLRAAVNNPQSACTARLEALDTICAWSMRKGGVDADVRAAVLATLALGTSRLAPVAAVLLQREEVTLMRKQDESEPKMIKIVMKNTPGTIMIKISPKVSAAWVRHMRLCHSRRTPLLFPVTPHGLVMPAAMVKSEVARACKAAGVTNVNRILPPAWLTESSTPTGNEPLSEKRP